MVEDGERAIGRTQGQLNGVAADLDLWAVDAQFPGALIWLENGVRLRDAFRQLCLTEFSNAGYSHVALPYVLPATIYQRESLHFRGLRKYSYELRSASGEFSGYLRTTSETPFTHLFKHLWGSRQLPLRFVQDCTVFRKESDQLDPPLRSIEIHPFVESYSAHATAESAHECIRSEVAIYSRILALLALPTIITMRPAHDTFPEARYTIAFDSILPGGEVSQVATVHHLGDSFARAFDWSLNGEHPLQTSTGISARALGVALLTHLNGEAVTLPATLHRAVATDTRFSAHPVTLEADTIQRLLSTRIRHVTSCDALRAPWAGVTTFPLLSDDPDLPREIDTLLAPGSRCLGFIHPRQLQAEACIVTHRQPTSLCAVGSPV